MERHLQAVELGLTLSALAYSHAASIDMGQAKLLLTGVHAPANLAASKKQLPAAGTSLQVASHQ